MVKLHTDILRIWDDVRKRKPNKSTEWIMDEVRDQFRDIHRIEIDSSEIVDALEARLSER